MKPSHRLSRRLLALLLSAAALAIAWHAGLPERADYTGQIIAGLRVAPEVRAYAPPLRVVGLDGSLIDSASLPRPLLLNFWATWCEPCEREMPNLQQIHDEGLAYVLIVNQAETAGVVRAWMARHGVGLPVGLDDGQATRLYRVTGLPTSFIVAPDGRIGTIFYGAADAERLRAALTPYCAIP
ncbi:MAG: TlpA family protein disulfide reductase [Anaerolineae bacterium]|nr:TlpA family protein disulfide reductase [Anaerolineae bacterium]MDW8172400.1 TlpA disulfide reductase family protein [Anaerolineae bacterium]